MTGCRRCTYAGSLRRMRETIGDIDILGDRGGFRAAHGGVHRAAAGGRGDRQRRRPRPRSAPPTGSRSTCGWCRRRRWGAALQYFTGSKAHNIRIREIAVRKKLKLSEYGLFRADTGELLVAETEEEVYERLGMPWIPPTLREDRGEVEAALARRAARPGQPSGHPRRPAHAHQPHRRAGLAGRDGRRRGGPRLLVLRDHRPCPEPVHAAHDRREDARPAASSWRRLAGRRRDDAAARHRAQHRPGRRGGLARGVPRPASTCAWPRCTRCSPSRRTR